MVDIKNNYVYAGIILAVALITSLGTYQLVPAGNYRICNDGAGWQQIQSGVNEGQYSCGDRHYDCSNIRGTKTGKDAYYCDEATRVIVETKTKVVNTVCPPTVATSCSNVKVVKYDYDGTKWICNELGQECAKFDDLIANNFN